MYDINKSWLNSDSFVKRAFAIYGYALAGVAMLYAGILALVLIGAIISIPFSF